MLRILVVFAMTSGLALAQTTGTLNPNPLPPPADKNDLPAGSCMPIGVTAAGDLVFPFQCKTLLDQTRGRAAADETAAAARKPAVDDAPVASDEKSASRDEAIVEKQPEPSTEKQPDQPAQKQQTAATPQDENRSIEVPVKAAPPSRRSQRESRKRIAGSSGCTHYRTYNSASASYRDYGGHLRQCLY
jgi:outer membrane biosynthesis protein TonB